MATSNSPSKTDLEDLIDETYERLQDAFDPRLSREMAGKIGDILDDLAPEGSDEDDEVDHDEEAEE